MNNSIVEVLWTHIKSSKDKLAWSGVLNLQVL